MAMVATASFEAMTLTRSSTDSAAENCFIIHASSGNAAGSKRHSVPATPRRGASSTVLQSSFSGSTTCLQTKLSPGRANCRRKLQVSCSMLGEDPEWSAADYIVLGLAHCFQQEEGGKLRDVFLIEPVSASTLECLENGGATSYLHVTASSLGMAFKYDVSLLPPEFGSGVFCDSFDFRAKCVARTWKRPHAVAHLMNIAPSGSVRSDYNFSLADKRVINKERVVTDSDNIKQDMSIDVYGRTSSEAKEEASSEIASLYNA